MAVSLFVESKYTRESERSYKTKTRRLPSREPAGLKFFLRLLKNLPVLDSSGPETQNDRQNQQPYLTQIRVQQLTSTRPEGLGP